MGKVGTVEEVEVMFRSFRNRKSFLCPVRKYELSCSLHWGRQLHCSLRSDDDGLVGEVDPAVRDEGGGSPSGVSEADAGRLVTAFLPQVSTGRHSRLVSSIHQLGKLDGVHSEVEDASSSELLLVKPVNLDDSS